MSDICYKVVRKIDGKFYSSNTALGHGRLQYKINEKTRPIIKNSKIFVFCKLGDAIEFINDIMTRINADFEILKCSCEYSSNRRKIRRLSSSSGVCAKIEFWNEAQILDKIYYDLTFGTSFANWIKPIKIMNSIYD